jgi:hypothetical protein
MRWLRCFGLDRKHAPELLERTRAGEPGADVINSIITRTA